MLIVRPTPFDTIAHTLVSSFQRLAPIEPVEPILRRKEEATCPKLIPLSDIPEYSPQKRFVGLAPEMIGTSYDITLDIVPAAMPAVTAWEILAPSPLVAVHNTDVSDFHSEASQTDTPIILLSVLSEDPRLNPATVDKMDPVAAMFNLDAELNPGGWYETARVKDPVDPPDVSCT
jgi:hypothetical protein